MRKRNLIIGLVLTLAIGSGITAYATTTNNTTPNNITNRACGSGMGFATGQRGYESVEDVLKNKLGMTDSEIAEARNSGKTMYEIAKEKGLSEEDFKAALLEERYKTIDDAVEKGTITKEKGEEYKTQIKNNIDNCTLDGYGMMRNKGTMMGKNQRNCF
ncbi:MAG: hypothetical protein AB6733_16070 [Clostridiaceae bacterium]